MQFYTFFLFPFFSYLPPLLFLSKIDTLAPTQNKTKQKQSNHTTSITTTTTTKPTNQQKILTQIYRLIAESEARINQTLPPVLAIIIMMRQSHQLTVSHLSIQCFQR